MAREISIGRQDFETLRLNGNFYVDKTGFVRDWWRADDDVTLICRPRRFGKTLNLDTVRSRQWGFRTVVNSEYVDKAALLTRFNSNLDNLLKLVSVSRPRRSGRSIAAKMLVAYYGCSCSFCRA